MGFISARTFEVGQYKQFDDEHIDKIMHLANQRLLGNSVLDRNIDAQGKYNYNMRIQGWI